MIASFFRHLEQYGVEWLLVSGQATILYGAATFSEDVDLWVEPSAPNLERLLTALRASRARYYKLTPALTHEMAIRHHGFHFTVPDDQDSVLYLDVMACPPRVGDFGEANARSRVFETHWGALRTVGLRDLVELKKTQRPRDYPIISRLVLAFMAETGAACTEQDVQWATDNTFSLPEFRQLVTLHPETRRGLRDHSLLDRAASHLQAGEALDATLEDDLEDWFDSRTAPLRKADRRFWRGVIEDLRQLRAQGALTVEGSPV
jgi:hypothetical protein